MATNLVNRSKWALWRNWVAANAVGEMLGLGATFVMGAVVIPRLEQQAGALAALLSFAVAVASGAIEATIVGPAQWWAMRSAINDSSVVMFVSIAQPATLREERLSTIGR